MRLAGTLTLLLEVLLLAGPREVRETGPKGHLGGCHARPTVRTQGDRWSGTSLGCRSGAEVAEMSFAVCHVSTCPHVAIQV